MTSCALIQPPETLEGPVPMTAQNPLAPSGLRRLAQALTGLSKPRDVLPTAAQALQADGLRYLLLRNEPESGPRWVTTLPEWAFPEAYAEHLALLTYGDRLSANGDLDAEWISDVQADSQFLPTLPFAQRLGFRGLAFCPVRLTRAACRSPQGLVAFCWEELQEPTAEAADLLQSAAALVASTYAAARWARAAKELKSVPALDRATRLPSAALMGELGPRLIAAAERRREPLSCLVVRFDPASAATWAESARTDPEKLLHTIGMTLSALTRCGDMVGRLAEYEFVVLLPGAAQAGGMEVASRLVDGLSGMAVEEMAPNDIPPPVVAGVATRQAGPSYGSLLGLARTALEQATRQGLAVLVADQTSGELCGVPQDGNGGNGDRGDGTKES